MKNGEENWKGSNKQPTLPLGRQEERAFKMLNNYKKNDDVDEGDTNKIRVSHVTEHTWPINK